jgi:hypothetical protein
MTAVNRIKVFLDSGFCDDCLEKLLDIHPRQQVQQNTSLLATDPRYSRQIGECGCCHRTDKLVIRRRLALVA